MDAPRSPDRGRPTATTRMLANEGGVALVERTCAAIPEPGHRGMGALIG